MATFELPPDDFDNQFQDLLDGVLGMFPVEDVKHDGSQPPQHSSDVDKVVYAEKRVKEWRAGARERVDAAREDLRSLSREYEHARLSSARSATHPSAAEHEAKLGAMLQARVTGMKANSELEQQVYRLQGELERLQQELKDEEADAVEVAELNSEVLRIKMYRDMGFAPIDENGIYTKFLVRSATSPDARTVQLDPSVSDFQWCNFLWGLVDSSA
ncbi:hypothetical protein JCM1840_005773 [Sporobolomyces johnsonii]